MTSPIGVASTPQRRRRPSTSSSLSGETSASIRSCDSEQRISQASIDGSRSGTLSRSTRMPMPRRGHLRGRAGDAGRAHVLDAAQQVAAYSSRQLSMSSLPANGSPTWTLGASLVDAVLAELRAGQDRRAADAVATGALADEHGDVAGPLGAGELDAVGGQHTRRTGR
jgi:hypothetical protein